jgi:hypothetical protein
METVTEKLSNGNEITYKVIGGTAFHVDTPESVVNILLGAMCGLRSRLRLFLGDPETGRDWGEEDYCSIGYIGRSTGRIKIPLCVYNRKSTGGPALLDDRIVKIMDVQTKRVLYQHPNYHQPVYTLGKPPEKIGNVTMEEYQAGVYADGENVANFKTERQANHWIAFMRGERMRK